MPLAAGVDAADAAAEAEAEADEGADAEARSAEGGLRKRASPPPRTLLAAGLAPSLGSGAWLALALPREAELAAEGVGALLPWAAGVDCCDAGLA